MGCMILVRLHCITINETDFLLLLLRFFAFLHFVDAPCPLASQRPTLFAPIKRRPVWKKMRIWFVVHMATFFFQFARCIFYYTVLITY